MPQNRRKKKKPAGGKKMPWGVLFWLAFILVLLGLYLFNRQAINNSILIIQREFFPGNAPVEPISETPAGPDVIRVPSPTQGAAPTPVDTPPSEPAATQPAVTTPSQTEPQNVQPQTGQNPQTTQEPQQGATELRERALYFTRIGSDGSVLRDRADRRLPASDSPLRDVIQALIAGPNAAESQRGLISLIPEGTMLLSISIRGETAYINFNEDFQYNTYGPEGYKGQLRQIVYTATEFPTVKDVQILIDGNRVDFLSENIWIGSPLNREMF